MKERMQRLLGQSWKTSLVSYALAALLAVQPLLDAKTDLNNRYDFVCYLLRLLFAAGVALLGKFAADSSQVKELRKGLGEELGEKPDRVSDG